MENMSNYWTRYEQEQYSQRVDDEHHRQNRRIETLEKNYERLTELTLSVQKQTLVIESMSNEIKDQGEQIKNIINAPAKSWQRVKEKSIDTIVGIIVGALVAGIIALAVPYIG